MKIVTIPLETYHKVLSALHAANAHLGYPACYDRHETRLDVIEALKSLKETGPKITR